MVAWSAAFDFVSRVGWIAFVFKFLFWSDDDIAVFESIWFVRGLFGLVPGPPASIFFVAPDFGMHREVNIGVTGLARFLVLLISIFCQRQLIDLSKRSCDYHNSETLDKTTYLIGKITCLTR